MKRLGMRWFVLLFTVLLGVSAAGLGPEPALALGAAPSTGPATATPVNESTITRPSSLDLTLLHDNDLHGHLFPFPYTEKGRTKVEQIRGGAARRAILVHRLRSQIHHPVLLVDSGDIATRGPLWTTYEGIADVDALDAIGYDIAAVGNNEFKLKDGVEANDASGAQADLLQVVKRSRFPWVCANAVDGKGDFLEGVEPYVVRNIDGVRVGFLGLTAPRSASYPQTKGWTISDPIAAASAWIPQAREHCDVLIALTHISSPLDVQLAAHTRGIDAIVGGDDHAYLYKPIGVRNLDGVLVPIVQAGEFGVDLGRFDLHFDRDPEGHYHLTTYHDELLPVDAHITPDPAVTAVLAPYLQPMQQVVGHVPPIAATAAGREKQTAQVVMDAARRETGSDIAITQPGDGFFETFRSSVVTRYDVYFVEPFENDFSTSTLTGAEIKSLLDAHPDAVVSGSANTLQPAHAYTVAFMDFIADSDYHIPASKLHDTGQDLRTAVIRYLQTSAP